MTKTVKTIPNLVKKQHYGKLLTYILYGLLIAWLSLGHFIRPEGGSFAVWLIQTIPLLVLAPGLYKQYYRSFSWLCFIILGYFIFAVEHSLMNTANYFDYVFLTLTVLLFNTAMMTSRWLQYYQKNILDSYLSNSEVSNNEVSNSDAPTSNSLNKSSDEDSNQSH